jgi:hypothetical protein
VEVTPHPAVLALLFLPLHFRTETYSFHRIQQDMNRAGLPQACLLPATSCPQLAVDSPARLMLKKWAMRRCKSCGLALFVLLSVTTLFITPGVVDDFEGMSQGVHVRLAIVNESPEVHESRLSSFSTKSAHIPKTVLSRPEQSAKLLDLVCVRLC